MLPLWHKLYRIFIAIPAIDDTLLQQYDVAAVCTRYRQLGKT